MAFEIQKLLAQKPKIPHLNGQEKDFCRSNSPQYLVSLKIQQTKPKKIQVKLTTSHYCCWTWLSSLCDLCGCCYSRLLGEKKYIPTPQQHHQHHHRSYDGGLPLFGPHVLVMSKHFRSTTLNPENWRSPKHYSVACGMYPLVNIQKAIENGHWNSGFTHQKWWIFPVRYVNVYQRVYPSYKHIHPVSMGLSLHPSLSSLAPPETMMDVGP